MVSTNDRSVFTLASPQARPLSGAARRPPVRGLWRGVRHQPRLQGARQVRIYLISRYIYKYCISMAGTGRGRATARTCARCTAAPHSPPARVSSTTWFTASPGRRWGPSTWCSAGTRDRDNTYGGILVARIYEFLICLSCGFMWTVNG